MKFDKAKYWRQFGECCMFVEVVQILSDTGDTAELKVTHCRQLDKDWKRLATENINVRSRDYVRWVSYFPRGDGLNAS